MDEETNNSYIVILNFNRETHTCNMIYINRCKRKRKRSDSVLRQKPLHPEKNPNKQCDNTKKPPKTSMTQRLQTDLGRSVGVTTTTTGVVKPVYERSSFPVT